MIILMVNSLLGIYSTFASNNGINNPTSTESTSTLSDKLMPIINKTWSNLKYDLAWSIAVDEAYIYVAGVTDSYGSGFKNGFIL